MKALTFFSLFTAPILLYPTLTSAQSAVAANPAVVSVQELTLSPKAVKTFKKGTTLLLKGDAQASLPYLRAVTSLAPNYYGSYHNIGLAESHLGQLDDAAANFQKSIDLTNGRFAPSLFGLAMILYRRSEFVQAESLIDRGLVAAPGSAVGKYCLGLVQFSAGQLAQSQRSALDALRLDPTLAESHVLLAHIDERHNDPYGVLAEVQLYLKLFPHGDLQEDALALRDRAQHHLARLSVSLN
jgi:tetratricopeptide (TPR) repeat protein